MKIFKIIILLSMVMVSGCRKELLSPIPQGNISDLVAFETPERTLATVHSMYSAVKHGQIYGGRFLVYQDVRGEEFINETNNAFTNLQTWNFTVTPSTNEVQNFWGAAYGAINRINVVIDGVSKAPISDALKNQYRAEGRLLRALVYHALITIYGSPYADGNGSKPGVIIYTEPQTSSGNNLKARSTVAEVYTQIISDLDFAETNLPVTQSPSALNITRAHRNTAIALKTRMYLFMGKYAEVITEANKIVSTSAPFSASSGVLHKLEANVTNVFGANGQTLENIFSMPFTSQDQPGTQNSLNSYYSPGTSSSCSSCSGTGEYSLNTGATGITGNSQWTSTDARRAFIQTIGTKTWMRKWTANIDYVPVIRYAEVLLNLAEALARTSGVTTKAVDLLNAVRQRSDGTTTLAPGSQTELINMILFERRLELIGEGMRSRDLLRLLQPIPAKGTISSLAGTDPQYLWPIPLTELFVNPVQQNQGY